MARARAVKALYAVLLTGLLAAPAPAVDASADGPRTPARLPGERPQASPAPAPAPAPASPSAAAPAAPAPSVRPTPRPPGVRGLEIAVPAYVWADDPVLADLTATGPAASVVVLNPGNGDAPFDAPWRARADALRAGTTATGERTKVLGYVHTDHGNRDLAEIKASVDNYLRPTDAAADGRLHVDGIFFDVVSRDCGPANATRDRYAELRRYVEDTMHAVDPDAPDLVVNNPGTPIADCYLEPGRRTADVFVTFEDTYAAYTSAGPFGGNVFNAATGYRPGAELDPSGTAFWHLVHDVPDASAMRATLRTAFERGAGYAFATSTVMPNPWNAAPAWKFRPQTSYAATLG
ncbi:spherulation-specific family 4 protein [Streptomyces sp. NBC_00249]|uniref:spherulation-specific family 4 protein n=1 Tax=Streptomyces sp. NBC_00249 TaxID=2975690 RepID=UPI002257347C|nr:spherulation-specific family 4 protein [Streptomyces sp. NBC_00249]MCX5197149.1 spherulation-specific family 4 protein [Streptomyces sp. NBC_00249]